jgi:hypothetical protein
VVEFTGVTNLLTRFGGYGGSIPGHKIALTPFW